MTSEESRPAFYAARQGGWRDWWTLLHPPYTVWHLSYVVIGACLAPAVSVSRLLATLLGFFLAVGVAAHAYDELQGRPLRTRIPGWALVAACVVGLGGAVTLGILGVADVGVSLVPFVVVGPLLVVAYNAELFGGVVHTDAGFALCWGAFPLLTAYVAQAQGVSWGAAAAAVGAAAMSFAQRALSSPARQVRRQAVEVHGAVTFRDGREATLDGPRLIAPLERALRALALTAVLLALGLALTRLG
jgi:hypothetical protein